MIEQKYFFNIRVMRKEIDAMERERARYELGSPERQFFGLRKLELEEDLREYQIFMRRYFAEQAKKGNK
jgi:hypothetical protein